MEMGDMRERLAVYRLELDSNILIWMVESRLEPRRHLLRGLAMQGWDNLMNRPRHDLPTAVSLVEVCRAGDANPDHPVFDFVLALLIPATACHCMFSLPSSLVTSS